MKRYVLDDVSQNVLTVSDDVKVLTVKVKTKPKPAVTVDAEFATLLAIISSILGLVILV